MPCTTQGWQPHAHAKIAIFLCLAFLAQRQAPPIPPGTAAPGHTHLAAQGTG